MRIAVLAGDGIGPEVIGVAVAVLRAVRPDLELIAGDVGVVPLEREGTALPQKTLELVHASAAILFGSVGDPRYDGAPSTQRPEYALFTLRKSLDLFANLRPAKLYAGLEDASPLRPEVVRGTDLLVVRETTGGLYFGQPKEQRTTFDGTESAVDTCAYDAPEVERVARVAFDLARTRRKHVTSIDKENVLETSRLWRRVVTRTAADYPDVRLDHLLADNASMQLLRRPRDFDVLLADNMFGDILSDEAAMITGSIGMLPSATLNAATNFGLYEPIGGTAPDIAGAGIANPVAAVLCAALLLRHTAGDEAGARRIEAAVESTLAHGVRTADIAAGGPSVGTEAFARSLLGEILRLGTTAPAR